MSYKWLTARDKDIYSYLLNNAKYASTSQLTELFFKTNDKGKNIKNCKQICRRRLNALEENITEITSFYRQANSDKIYTVLPPKEHAAPLSRIEHSLSLNDLYIQIRAYAKRHGHTIHTFMIEPQIKDNIIPDILMIYVINKKARIFFIEYDTGSENMNRIKKKLDRYATYMMRQHYLSEDWQPASIKPEVAFITSNPKRMQSIQKLGTAAHTDVLQLLSW